MATNKAEITVDTGINSQNPLDFVPNEIPFDVPYGPPISLERAEAVIHAAVAEAKRRNWKMNVAIADSGGNLVAFQRMDGAMLASIQIAELRRGQPRRFGAKRKYSKTVSTSCISITCSRSMESSRLEAAYR
jgi:hypothetical protein